MTGVGVPQGLRLRGNSVSARVAAVMRVGLTVVGCLLIASMAANAWVVSATRGLIYDDISRLGVHDVGVVLGTSPYTRYGNQNLLFTHRMMAAAELYAAGRVRHLLVSGSNPDRTYNEPRKMYQALRRLGVPDAAITLDFAGFRTLDSIVRANRIFGLESYIVVSQRYHDYRALFIADHYGIDAVAYIRPEEDRRQPLRTEAREYLARVKAVVDLFLLSTRPRFLGPQRPIDIEPVAPFDFLVRQSLFDDHDSRLPTPLARPAVPPLLRRLPVVDQDD
ncbi:ElyC/SanA/YdcF family protein [Salinisphaera sp. T31B1]|uniref:SanA/YdcF family protein n=1 Tax=Salinisphaera sp. T31B1 TaxID=727963 RepID=UPI00334262FC